MLRRPLKGDRVHEEYRLGRQLTCKGTTLTATRVLRTPSQRRLIGPYTCRRAQLIRPCPFHSRLMTSGSSR